MLEDTKAPSGYDPFARAVTAPKLGLLARRATMLVAILLVVTAACSSGSDPSESQLTIDRQSDGRDDIGGDGPETPTTNSTTSTSEAPTTDTTLTQEQEEFLEEVALADRLMVPIREYQASRASCLADPPNCDLDTLTEHTVEAYAEINQAAIETRVAEREFVVDPHTEVHYVRHAVTGQAPFYAEVWTCQIRGAAFYILDTNDNRIDETPAEPRAEYIVYGLLEEADGALRIDQLDALGEPDDPKPEGGTCGAYKEWPPALPSS